MGVNCVRASLVAVTLCAFLDAASAQVPVRDAVRSPSAGTAVIAGVVVTDDKDARPLRRTRVLLTNADHEHGRTVITDDAGRFAFTGLAPDRYVLSAKKAGYVTMEYGARRSARPGVAIVVGDGQRLTDVILRLPRGAVIAGAIVDQNGQPVSGAGVRPLRYQFTESGRRMLTSIESYASTNDLGQYRIWGLDAGEYVVTASMPETVEPWVQDLVRMTDADIKQAEADATGFATRSTVPTSRRAGYAPMYYPGTFAASEGAAIRLAAGEERPGIDFQLSLISTATVEGTVVFPSGIERQSLFIQLTGVMANTASAPRVSRSAHLDDQSHFSFSGVPPGQFILTARTEAAPQPTGADGSKALSAPATTQWAHTDVTVSGDDISGISLVLQPAFSVSGTVQIDAIGSPPDVSRLLVMLTPAQPVGDYFGAMPRLADANGAFTIVGVTPGRYQVRAGFMTFRGADDIWQVKSAIVNGRETVDDPIELRTGVDGVVVTLTDRMPSVTGVVRDASGRPAAASHIVIFAKDRRYWMPDSRRLMSVRPASDGHYLIRSVPAGDYFITAIDDLEPGEWFDPSLLEQLAKSAVTITLAEGEKKTQDLRLVDRR
jgi:protocatechuate 3,4-dioxygenase beta subunit